MISAVHFKNFKALRSTAVRLEPFNLLIGPSGSGKTSLIEALLRLRYLAGQATAPGPTSALAFLNGPQIEFHFHPPFQNVRVTLGCQADELSCHRLRVDHPPGLAGAGQWAELRTQLQGIRAYLLDHQAMGAPGLRSAGTELAANASNLAAVLAQRAQQAPVAFAHLVTDFCRIMPEFSGFDFRGVGEGHVELRAALRDSPERLSCENLSQGTLYLLAILTLAHDPQPPTLVCLEEADRGVHPRLLREVRDALYRLSYPVATETPRPVVQVVATTHAPYLLDLFRDHPSEIVLAHKQGNAASFERLTDRPDVLELMRETNLGDLWYSGILGGIPGD